MEHDEHPLALGIFRQRFDLISHSMSDPSDPCMNLWVCDELRAWTGRHELGAGSNSESCCSTSVSDSHNESARPSEGEGMHSAALVRTNQPFYR